MVYLIILRGPYGSGKSTVAKMLQEKLGGKTAILSPGYFYWKVTKNEDAEPEVIYSCLEKCAEAYLDAGYNVVLEGILSLTNPDGTLRIDNLLGVGVNALAQTKLFYLNISLDLSKKRNLKREKEELTEKVYETSSFARHKSEIEIDSEKLSADEVTDLIISRLRD